ncbi:MAG: hypothetical protein GX327_08415 [Epulopiscium sp.]|jgi:hypothetical protein|nr:hypothetical protein [Candidatus Epulonipiscium sp.]
MINLNILDVKKAMDELLKGNLFDEFEVRITEVHTFTKFHIDGSLNKAFLNDEEKKLYNRNFVLWKEVKPHVFNIIKGKRPPTYLKIVFSAGKDIVVDFPSEISALFINLIYSQGNFSCTSGIALNSFSLNKEIEYEWDNYVHNFFKKANIYVE